MPPPLRLRSTSSRFRCSMDEVQLVGERLGVQREGEVFVLNPKDSFRIAYHGPLDSRFTQGAPNLKARRRTCTLRRAIDAVLAGQTVANPRVNLKVGQTIAFPQNAAARRCTQPSPIRKRSRRFSGRNAVTCHQKGGIGPFQMSSYEVVKGFAPMIREAVRTKRMPPWFADPHVGTSQTTRRSRLSRPRLWSTGSRRARLAARVRTS